MRRRLTRASVALVVALAVSASTTGEEAARPTTLLLIARDGLPDPNFRDAVVLVMNNIAAAPAGVIVNRPTRVGVARLFPDIDRLAQLDAKVYFGGPVDTTTVSFLFRADARPDHAVRVVDGVYFSADRDLLRTLLSRDEPMRGLKILTGFSGWAPGQLEAEIARGDWMLAPADADALFERRRERPWPERDAPNAGRRA